VHILQYLPALLGEIVLLRPQASELDTVLRTSSYCLEVGKALHLAAITQQSGQPHAQSCSSESSDPGPGSIIIVRLVPGLFRSVDTSTAARGNIQLQS
jgi:hypothetical protein